MFRALINFAAIASLLLATPGLAQADKEQAKKHYQQARTYFQQNRFSDAIRELKAARKHDPDSPNLVYNLGRAYEMKGDERKARAYYLEYMAMVPKDSREYRDAAAVVERLEKYSESGLVKDEKKEPAAAVTETKDDDKAAEEAAKKEEVVEESKKNENEDLDDDAVLGDADQVNEDTEEPEAEPIVDEQAEVSSSDDDLVTVLFVTGGALLAGGVVFGVLALDQQSTANEATTRAAYDDASDTASTYGLISDFMIVGAAASAGVALYLWLTSDDDTETAQGVQPWIAADGRSVAVGLGGQL